MLSFLADIRKTFEKFQKIIILICDWGGGGGLIVKVMKTF
jgi:hypothetical protein